MKVGKMRFVNDKAPHYELFVSLERLDAEGLIKDATFHRHQEFLDEPYYNKGVTVTLNSGTKIEVELPPEMDRKRQFHQALQVFIETIVKL